MSIPGQTRTLVIEATCEQCPADGMHTSAHWCLIEMQPGPDGIPWYLCLRHWFAGLHPNSTRELGDTGRVLEREG